MRIALLAHAPVFGGSTDLFLQARDFFRSRGHTVQAIFGHDATPADPRTADSWVMPPASRDWRKRIRDYCDRVQGFGPNLVYSIAGRDEADLLRFLPHVRVRHLSSLEEHEYFNVPHTLRTTARFLEACTANTPDTQAQVRAICGRPTFLLPYLFPEPLRPVTAIESARLADPAGRIEVAFVSRLERFQKRAHWLPEIIRACAAAGAPLDWHIYGDGPCGDELRAALPSDARVFFHGWVSREALYESLPRHDLFFLCSRWEGLPIAMVEAMRCGLACVAPDIPAGIRWTLTQGGGWLYAATSPRAAAQALLAAVRDRDLLLEKRRQALDLAARLFAPDVARGQFLELEAALQNLAFNGDYLQVADAPKFRAVSLPAYLRRILLRPAR
jgi:glycosyltransferase involved in cell wall biosynthesis